jgi:hypothetical protein
MLLAGQVAAEQWVTKMFSEQEHDFGTVARGADTVYRFPVKNIYKQTIELVSVRSSCGCTSPTLENKTLQTGETGYVVASFNTRTFTGLHGATLTLFVEWNDNGTRRRGEGQLRVNGNIRSDVVFKPGAIKFEGIDQGNKQEQQVQITYAGRGDWKISDVRGESNDIEVELTQTQRNGNRVTYDLLVRVKDSAPAGYFREQLVLVTNDDRNPRIPLHVEGRVIPVISVSPEPLMFGEIVRGESMPKKILVRGKKPFKIVSMNCDDECFKFKTDETSSDRHIVEVTFAAKCDPGKVKQTIHIETDLGASFQASLTAYATVKPSPADAAEEAVNVTSAADHSAVKASGGSSRVAAQ